MLESDRLLRRSQGIGARSSAAVSERTEPLPLLGVEPPGAALTQRFGGEAGLASPALQFRGGFEVAAPTIGDRSSGSRSRSKHQCPRGPKISLPFPRRIASCFILASAFPPRRTRVSEKRVRDSRPLLADSMSRPAIVEGISAPTAPRRVGATSIKLTTRSSTRRPGEPGM